jgi:hypothetical protein
MSYYWLGVATPITLAIVVGLLVLAVGRAMTALDNSRWFIEFGDPTTETRVWFAGRVDVRGKWGIYYCVFRNVAVGDFHRWGSRFICIGSVAIGRTSDDLYLHQKPPVEERTE